jgi:hypothetical protein
LEVFLGVWGIGGTLDFGAWFEAAGVEEAGDFAEGIEAGLTFAAGLDV